MYFVTRSSILFTLWLVLILTATAPLSIAGGLIQVERDLALELSADTASIARWLDLHENASGLNPTWSGHMVAFRVVPLTKSIGFGLSYCSGKLRNVSRASGTFSRYGVELDKVIGWGSKKKEHEGHDVVSEVLWGGDQSYIVSFNDYHLSYVRFSFSYFDARIQTYLVYPAVSRNVTYISGSIDLISETCSSLGGALLPLGGFTTKRIVSLGFFEGNLPGYRIGFDVGYSPIDILIKFSVNFFASFGNSVNNRKLISPVSGGVALNFMVVL